MTGHLFVINGVLTDSYYPLFRPYGIELLKPLFTCKTLLSQFPFGIYYVMEISQPNDFKEVHLNPAHPKNHPPNTQQYNWKYSDYPEKSTEYFTPVSTPAYIFSPRSQVKLFPGIKDVGIMKKPRLESGFWAPIVHGERIPPRLG
jgi:hypothetical protein